MENIDNIYFELLPPGSIGFFTHELYSPILKASGHIFTPIEVVSRCHGTLKAKKPKSENLQASSYSQPQEFLQVLNPTESVETLFLHVETRTTTAKMPFRSHSYRGSNSSDDIMQGLEASARDAVKDQPVNLSDVV